MPIDARVVIVGAGGHAKVVMDALQSGDPSSQRCFADDDLARAGQLLLGCAIEGPIAKAVHAGDHFHVAIGNNPVRQRLHAQLSSAGAQARTVIHPRAVVSSHAVLGHGVFVAAAAVVAPTATVHDGVIVNHGAVVDHDCVVGAFTHIAPNATLGGGVTVGALVLIGAGATVLPGVDIGEGAVIGAGAVVVRSVPAGEIFCGVPARAARRS
ncbi:MAG: hypothetical protein RLZZ618_3379 [Pseudomonadota bacterium]|jgi:sugar O-acyltransferase (sialic acid O-acetyltransferase NeuD family)